MNFLSRYFTNLCPPQRKEKRCEGPRWVGQQYNSVPLLLFLLPFSCHVAADKHQQFWKDRHSPGLLRANFLPVGGEKWVVNVLFGMASQVLKKGWRKRQEGLVSQRCRGFPFLHKCYRSEVLLTTQRLCSGCPCVVSLILSVHVPLSMRKGPGEDLSRTSSP